MCIAAFIWQSHPLYPFLLLFNRDEYHSRRTKQLEWWEGGEIIGGRDDVAGGTWLACSRSGRLAFLTNVRETQVIPDAKSRGGLPVRFLKSEKDPLEFAEEVMEEAGHYNGFNLIVADFCSKQMFHLTNRAVGDDPSISPVSPGVHVLTNANLLDCHWSKSRRLKQKFEEWVEEHGEGEMEVKEMVEKLMKDTVKANKDQLPGIFPQHVELERSSVFVDSDDSVLGRYGTRSTSAVTLSEKGEVSFYERNLENDSWTERAETYKISAKA